MSGVIEEHHCIVTGSASGIGEALTKRLLEAGWRVTGLDRQGHGDMPGKFSAIEVDLLDKARLESVLTELAATNPTAFVHSAGAMRTGRLADEIDADSEFLWRLHVDTAMTLGRILGPALPEQRGRIVLLSSRGALGRPGRGAYAASKAALHGLIRSWALELAPKGVTVNVVAPGAVDTPMLTDPSRGEPPQVSLPIGRLIHPQEIAAPIEFLLSADAAAITGQTLYVCGGASLVAPG